MLITKQQIDAVISRIYSGESTTRAIENENLDVRSFYRTLATCFLSEQEYSHACKASARRRAEEIIEIADEDPDPQRARNRIIARQWLAGKMDPRNFGERLDVTIDSHVDIRATLEEARARSPLLPIRDLPIPAEYQVVDTNRKSPSELTDRKPVDPIVTPLKQPIGTPDDMLS